MNGDIDSVVATIIAIAILAGFVVLVRQPSRDLAPQNRGGGCLIFILSALAVLLGIANGITQNAAARAYSDFYLAVAIALFLFGLQRSGVDVYGGAKRLCRPSPHQSFLVAWLVSACSFMGIGILTCACLIPMLAMLMRACGAPSFTLGIPYVRLMVFEAPIARLRVFPLGIASFIACAALAYTLRQRSRE